MLASNSHMWWVEQCLQKTMQQVQSWLSSHRCEFSARNLRDDRSMLMCFHLWLCAQARAGARIARANSDTPSENHVRLRGAFRFLNFVCQGIICCNAKGLFSVKDFGGQSDQVLSNFHHQSYRRHERLKSCRHESCSDTNG